MIKKRFIFIKESKIIWFTSLYENPWSNLILKVYNVAESYANIRYNIKVCKNFNKPFYQPNMI